MNKLTKINSCSGVELDSQSHDQQCSESSDTGSESTISSFSRTSSPNMPVWGKKCFFTLNIWHYLELTDCFMNISKRTSLILQKAKNAASFPLSKFNLKKLLALFVQIWFGAHMSNICNIIRQLLDALQNSVNKAITSRYVWVTVQTGMNLHPELLGFNFVTVVSVKRNSL